METCLPSQVVVNLTITSGGKLVSITCDWKFSTHSDGILFKFFYVYPHPKRAPFIPLPVCDLFQRYSELVQVEQCEVNFTFIPPLKRGL